MFGVAFGVLGCMAALWLNALTVNIRDQGDALKTLNNTVREASDSQRAALEVVLNAAPDGKGDEFVAAFSKLSRERDSAVQNLGAQKLENDLLAAATNNLKKNFETVQKELDRSKKLSEANEKELKEAKTLRDDIKVIRDRNADLEIRSEQLDRILESDDGKGTDALLRRYDMTWWAMVAGWVLSVLLALGLIAVVAGNRFLPEKPSEAAPEYDEPHQIS
jgi:hypothetical protein